MENRMETLIRVFIGTAISMVYALEVCQNPVSSIANSYWKKSQSDMLGSSSGVCAESRSTWTEQLWPFKQNYNLRCTCV